MVALVLLSSVGCTEGDIGDGATVGGSLDETGPGDTGTSAGSPDASADEPDPEPEPDAGPPPDAPPPEPEPCEDGLRNAVDPATGACYMYFDTELPWQIALAACATLGRDTHLATVTSETEVLLLQQIGLDAADVWLGATDAASEGTFIWMTGEPLVFDNWRAGEPNDGNSPDRSEDCMVQEVDNGGTWDDRSCVSLFPYFCERD